MLSFKKFTQNQKSPRPEKTTRTPISDRIINRIENKLGLHKLHSKLPANMRT